MKPVFTYKNKYYGYEIVHGEIETYEILETHDEPLEKIDVEEKNNKLTDEEWEEIIAYCDELDS